MRKGIWVRDHLRSNGSDYTYGIWYSWSLSSPKGGGSYQSMRNFIYVLKRLRLIRKVKPQPRSDPPNKGLRKAVYYEVVPEKFRDPSWSNPLKALYP